MNLNIDFWRLLELLIGFAVFSFGFGKILLAQVSKRIDDQFAALKKDVDELKTASKDIARIEREFLEHKAAMPLYYVRREDYVRGQTVIEAKLDTLYERLGNVMLERWNGRERRRANLIKQQEEK
jgi:hypothetical protein